MDIAGPLGPLLAFWAGLLSVLSPCVLPLVPAYISHLAGQAAGTGAAAVAARGSPRFAVRDNAAFPHAVAFVSGFSVLFVAMGASVGVAGYALQDHQGLLGRIAGAAIIAMGLHVSGVIRLPFLERSYQVDVGVRGSGLRRSFVIGSAFAVGWTPCIGPVLGGILGLATTSGTAWQGALLLAFYSMGLSVPFLLAGAALGPATSAVRGFSRFMPAVSVASGALLIAMGIIIFTGEFTVFNRYFDLFGTGTGV